MGAIPTIQQSTNRFWESNPLNHDFAAAMGGTVRRLADIPANAVLGATERAAADGGEK